MSFLVLSALFVAVVAVLVLTGQITLTKIDLDQSNRMVRLGGGLHDGKWFVRLDLWSVGFRLTK